MNMELDFQLKLREKKKLRNLKTINKLAMDNNIFNHHFKKII